MTGAARDPELQGWLAGRGVRHFLGALLVAVLLGSVVAVVRLADHHRESVDAVLGPDRDRACRPEYLDVMLGFGEDGRLVWFERTVGESGRTSRPE